MILSNNKTNLTFQRLMIKRYRKLSTKNKEKFHTLKRIKNLSEMHSPLKSITKMKTKITCKTLLFNCQHHIVINV